MSRRPGFTNYEVSIPVRDSLQCFDVFDTKHCLYPRSGTERKS